ncbi:hypothetical protein RDABS01_026907 [Bienertia sinuspersici]
MHIGSSTTTFSHDTYDKKVIKPPDHVQQERIRLHICSKKVAGGLHICSNKVVSKLGTSQTVQSHSKHDFPLRLMVSQLMLSMMQKRRFSHGSIQPIDILSNNGVKYYVELYEFHQPIRKGRHILVRFLRYIGKMAHYCPIGAITWHDVKKNLKVQIVNKMREHFIIPDDEVYDTLAQQHKKTHEQHYDLVPSGHSRSDWIKLVDHWFSPKGQKLSQIGKEARSLQCQVHTMGSNSYANLRTDYVSIKSQLCFVKKESNLFLVYLFFGYGDIL